MSTPEPLAEEALTEANEYLAQVETHLADAVSSGLAALAQVAGDESVIVRRDLRVDLGMLSRVMSLTAWYDQALYGPEDPAYVAIESDQSLRSLRAQGHQFRRHAPIVQPLSLALDALARTYTRSTTTTEETPA